MSRFSTGTTLIVAIVSTSFGCCTTGLFCCHQGSEWIGSCGGGCYESCSAGCGQCDRCPEPGDAGCGQCGGCETGGRCQQSTRASSCGEGARCGSSCGCSFCQCTDPHCRLHWDFPILHGLGRCLGFLCDDNCGCGEVYWHEFTSDPPARCEPCDRHGNWVGHASVYQAPYRTVEPAWDGPRSGHSPADGQLFGGFSPIRESLSAHDGATVRPRRRVAAAQIDQAGAELKEPWDPWQTDLDLDDGAEPAVALTTP